jgi:predicted AAA+ superfamily ATPase
MSTIYQNLDLFNGHGTTIRLLTILRGARGSLIRSSLAVASLDDDLHYEALSYTWGDPTVERAINVNENHSLKVTANLETALQYLRCPDKERVLWIDAICINQDDNAEKSNQVQLMSGIIGRALNVLFGWVSWMRKLTRLSIFLRNGQSSTGQRQL